MTGVNPKWPDVALPKGESQTATLLETFLVRVGGIGFDLYIPSGFGTDGASIPRWLWRICGHPLESPRVYAALVHDYLYSGIVVGITRKAADRAYRSLLRYYGVPHWRAEVEYLALRLFGSSHFTTNNKEESK